ncbi:hypothetical protein GA0115258_11654 [Streptomyces sp. LamerLS-31b]|nr:hypothetical protein GA0115258_11654 [Streptomyces sp. LamerLS-31b]
MARSPCPSFFCARTARSHAPGGHSGRLGPSDRKATSASVPGGRPVRRTPRWTSPTAPTAIWAFQQAAASRPLGPSGSAVSARATQADGATSRGRLDRAAGLRDLQLAGIDQSPCGAADRFHERAPAVVIPSVGRPRDLGGADRRGRTAAIQQFQDRSLHAPIHFPIAVRHPLSIPLARPGRAFGSGPVGWQGHGRPAGGVAVRTRAAWSSCTPCGPVKAWTAPVSVSMVCCAVSGDEA